MFTYIEDLQATLPKIKENEDDLERQKIVNDVHQKNNPFTSFYY